MKLELLFSYVKFLGKKKFRFFLLKMLPFVKLMRDHEQMITYFHDRITERARKLVNVHAETANTGGYSLLDGTERGKKLVFLNTEVMETISADFAIAVSREGVVDKFFASVSEYPPALPITVLPEPHLPPSIKASNKFRVLSCLVLYSLYLMLQWGLLLKECKDISFVKFLFPAKHSNVSIIRVYQLFNRTILLVSSQIST